MKVMQINCVYGSGSTGRLMKILHNGLTLNGHESIVCYGRGKSTDEKNVHKVSSELEAKVHSAFGRLLSADFGYSPIATARLIKLIKKERPDVVHLHCLNGHFVNVFKLVKFLKKNNIKTVLTLHAEIMHTAGCEHAVECEKWLTGCTDCKRVEGKLSRYFRDDAKYCYSLMKDAFDGFENLTVVGVSSWLTDRAARSPVFAGKHFETVNNCIDTNIFTPTECNALRCKLSIPEGKKIVLYVTPNFNHPIKGGKCILEAATKLPDYQFIIVGFNGDKSVLPENVIPISHTSNQSELAAFYSLADVTALTSLRETFSLVCAESLCCGTPIAAFKAGAPETICLEEYSLFCEQGDVDTLCKNIKTISKIKEEAGLSDTISQKAEEKFSAKRFLDEYFGIYFS